MPAEQRIRETLDAFAARVREDLDSRGQTLAAELTRAVQESAGAVRADAERTLAAERQQLDAQMAAERAALAGLKADLERTLEDERRRLEERLADERAALAGLHDASRRDQTAPSPLPRLLDAIRRLDAAPSLSSILGVLGQAVHARVSRTIVFVVDGEILKSWADYGFDEGPAVTDLPLHGTTVLSAALSSRASSTFHASSVEADSSVPAFLRPAAHHVGLVTPLSVGGDVVAVVYADGPETAAVGAGATAETGEAGAWRDEVELIARYARARLESVTSERTVSALTRMA